MKQNKLMRLQSLLVVMLTMFSMSAMAGGRPAATASITPRQQPKSPREKVKYM